jgi:hypothetical protein
MGEAPKAGIGSGHSANTPITREGNSHRRSYFLPNRLTLNLHSSITQIIQCSLKFSPECQRITAAPQGHVLQTSSQEESPLARDVPYRAKHISSD